MSGRARRPLLIGNWKMNGVRADVATIAAIDRALAANDCVDAVICPPYTLVAAAAAASRHIAIGGQDCHSRSDGPYPGGISAQMLSDVGARYVILGHSERRRAYSESDSDVAAKASVAMSENLVPVICVGETARDLPLAALMQLVGNQMQASLPVRIQGGTASVVIAYEPVWAIGSGTAPPMDYVRSICGALRAKLEKSTPLDRTGVRILYGGAVDALNALPLLRLAGIDGLLLGRSSLSEADFLAVAQVCSRLRAPSGSSGGGCQAHTRRSE